MVETVYSVQEQASSLLMPVTSPIYTCLPTKHYFLPTHTLCYSEKTVLTVCNAEEPLSKDTPDTRTPLYLFHKYSSFNTSNTDTSLTMALYSVPLVSRLKGSPVTFSPLPPSSPPSTHSLKALFFDPLLLPHLL